MAPKIKKFLRSKPLPAEFPGLHHMDEQEQTAVRRVLDAKCLYRYYGIEPQGEVDAFEKEMAEYLGVRHALGVTSGTAALHTALSALAVGPGQEVIIPAYLWVSVAAAVVNLGAIPVLADIDDTFCLSARTVAPKLTNRTRGIIAIHMNGVAADLPPLLALARDRNLFLLEDCAQCVGGSIHGRPVGSFGDISTFSFQINKNMTSGEGGLVATNNESLYKRAVACHDIGQMRTLEGRLEPLLSGEACWGLGYRMDELRAAVLRVQLSKLPYILERMRSSKRRLRLALSRHPEIAFRRVVVRDGDTGGFLITTYGDACTARAVSQSLRNNGIASTSPDSSNVVLADYGLHIYSNIRALVHKASNDGHGTPWTLEENRWSNVGYEKGTCPVADDLFDRSILMTVPSCLTPEDEADIVAAFASALDDVHQGQ